MAITNGYEAARVQAALSGRLGWKQPNDAKYAILDNNNQASASGRYFNGGSFHTALTVQNIYDCQSDRNITNAEFNTLLSERKNEMILSMLNTVFTENQRLESGLLCRKVPKTELRAITNTGTFCFWKINIAPGDYAVRLDNIQLLFNANASFKLYVFHELAGKITSVDVEVVANILKIQQLGIDLNYLSDTIKGGDFFIGYFQDDLGGAQAVSYSYCLNDLYLYGATPGKGTVTGAEMFNMNNYSISAENFGMNLEISVYRDITENIVLNAHVFDELLGLMMAKNIIEMILHSPRSNDTERISKDNLRQWALDLYGAKTDMQYIPSFEKRVRNEIARVHDSFFSKAVSQIVSFQ